MLYQGSFLRGISCVRGQLYASSNRTGSGRNCQSITPLVFRMSGMALYPMESHSVTSQKRQQTHPQIRILDLCEALPLPAFKPSFVDGIDHVGRVTPDMHLGIHPSDRLQSFYHRQKFHSVICGETESFRQLHLTPRTFEDDSIAPRAGVPAGSAVCIKVYRRSGLLFHTTL